MKLTKEDIHWEGGSFDTSGPQRFIHLNRVREPIKEIGKCIMSDGMVYEDKRQENEIHNTIWRIVGEVMKDE